MNTSVIASYAFIYSVLFLIVPFVTISFILTCIKFFKKENNMDTGSINIINKPQFCNKQVLNYIHDLNAISGGRYDVLYGLKMDELVEAQGNEELKSVLHNCTINYVVVDHDSSEIKLVITDEQDQEKTSLIHKIFSQFNINHIQITPNTPFDSGKIKTALTA
ncbi:hypothetical protein [Shewanella sp. NFH-SH190041]|uniref:hypothetical protein n=1 Tax=Shewanella sp. NFH-SH190041 TaxID=2950245 RepID=UPI0021C4212A|nr:hypothetical protein [Shewanella sp. NFH-SH190041]